MGCCGSTDQPPPARPTKSGRPVSAIAQATAPAPVAKAQKARQFAVRPPGDFPTVGILGQCAQIAQDKISTLTNAPISYQTIRRRTQPGAEFLGVNLFNHDTDVQLIQASANMGYVVPHYVETDSHGFEPTAIQVYRANEITEQLSVRAGIHGSLVTQNFAADFQGSKTVSAGQDNVYVSLYVERYLAYFKDILGDDPPLHKRFAPTKKMFEGGCDDTFGNAFVQSVSLGGYIVLKGTRLQLVGKKGGVQAGARVSVTDQEGSVGAGYTGQSGGDGYSWVASVWGGDVDLIQNGLLKLNEKKNSVNDAKSIAEQWRQTLAGADAQDVCPIAVVLKPFSSIRKRLDPDSVTDVTDDVPARTDDVPTARRLAPDGVAYTKEEFVEHFGGTKEWDAAVIPKKEG